MSNQLHDKLIKKAAKEILSPVGAFQKGQSRVWLDDNGWYMTQVEFQPSSWSKGSFLNVGVSFLWEKSEGLTDTLTFDVGYREKAFVEYKDDEEFYKKMIEFAEYAKNKIMHYRLFKDISFAKDELLRQNHSLWRSWNLSMLHFLNKEAKTGGDFLLETLKMCEKY